MTLEAEEGHRIPFIPKTDLTIERLQIVAEYLAKRALGIDPPELWAVADKVILAGYQRRSAEENRRRELLVENQKWIAEFGDKPLEDAVVVLEAGGIIPIQEFRCGQCKSKLLIGTNYVQTKYKNRQFSIANKDELFQEIRKELLSPNTSTYAVCHKCQNSTGNFRLVLASGK